MERSRTHTGDLEKSAKQVEELHESEKAALRAAERELVSLKEKIFKQSEVLGAARREEANIEAEISGADRSSRNATYRIKQLDEQPFEVAYLLCSPPSKQRDLRTNLRQCICIADRFIPNRILQTPNAIERLARCGKTLRCL